MPEDNTIKTSKMTEMLDETLTEMKWRKAFTTFVIDGEKAEKKEYKPVNLMFSGLPGTGKTSIIREWGSKHADEINFVEMDAAILRTAVLEGKRILFSDDEVEMMSRPDTVLFIDNYQYLNEEAEEELNKLLDFRKVQMLHEERTLDSILFVVVAVTVL